MQYYYECLEVYEKLVPEVKKHCKILRKLDAKFLVMRDSYLEALHDFEEQKDQMTPQIFNENKKVIDNGNEALNRLANEKWKTANSLMITVEYHLSRINGYVREFKCEIDSESSGTGTSIDIEKKFLEANRKRVKEIQDLREEYPFLDDLFKIPEAEPGPSEPVNEPVIEPIRINGHRQNLNLILQDIGSVFRDDPPGIRSSSNTSKKNSLKIKTERRGSINGGTPSPRALSPRPPKTPRFSNNNDSTTLALPEPSPSSNSVSPMEVSPGPHGNLGNMSFSYSENNILQNSSFSTMPSFSGSESRHGRQRKFTPKAQQMFKENKLGPGRPSNHLPLTNFSSSTGMSDQINSTTTTTQIPHFNTSSSNNQVSTIPQQQIKAEVPHPIASSSYSFPQDYSRLPHSTSQQQYTYSSMYINSHPQISAGTPQMPLQQNHQNATYLPQQHYQPPSQQQQQQQYYRPEQQVRLAMPNGNNIDGDGNEEDEDDREWCFCGEHSYGEMIACENPNCAYKWFHYGCIGIVRPPPGKWYCSECQKTLVISRN